MGNTIFSTNSNNAIIDQTLTTQLANINTKLDNLNGTSDKTNINDEFNTQLINIQNARLREFNNLEKENTTQANLSEYPKYIDSQYHLIDCFDNNKKVFESDISSKLLYGSYKPFTQIRAQIDTPYYEVKLYFFDKNNTIVYKDNSNPLCLTSTNIDNLAYLSICVDGCLPSNYSDHLILTVLKYSVL